jgi:hypothetical protein
LTFMPAIAAHWRQAAHRDRDDLQSVCKTSRCQLQRRFFVLAKSLDCSRALMSENPEAFATN